MDFSRKVQRMIYGLSSMKKMKHNGVIPNKYTYTCMINKHCNDGRTSSAFKLFDEMRERGVVCNNVGGSNIEEGWCNSHV
jgi:pentatricopeptide repeat protein